MGHFSEKKSAADSICVFHLIRAGTPLDVLARFLTSYERFPAGCSHRLTFLLKGFSTELPSGVAEMLDRVPHTRIACPDRGFDLGSYFYGSRRGEEHIVMFTNSYSVLQGDQWLAKIAGAYCQPRVGLVGATGSWESLASVHWQNRPDSRAPWPSRFHARGRVIALGLPLSAMFPAFPNPHLRTNAFMLARTDFLASQPRFLRTKLNAWLFESGRRSLTRQMITRGLDVRVVARDGSTYGPAEWMQSNTFWQSSQENLLIHDNRTLAYEYGDTALQTRWSRAAWGVHRRGISDDRPVI